MMNRVILTQITFSDSAQKMLQFDM